MNYKWEQQNFDTEIFGFRVAKIFHVSSEGSPRDLKIRIASLVTEFKKNKINYATYRLPTNDFSLIHALEDTDFILVDGIIAMNLTLKPIETLLHKNIRKALVKDLPQMKQIVKRSFTTNRFYNDPIILKDKADIVYEKWIENSLMGDQADAVLVWEEDNELLGFLTLQKKGHIPLVVVSKEARGKGIAKQLINASFETFYNWGCEFIEIETSLANIPALRAYEGCGFKICNSFVTLRWSNLV